VGRKGIYGGSALVWPSPCRGLEVVDVCGGGDGETTTTWSFVRF